jgi:alkaline phosphatase
VLLVPCFCRAQVYSSSAIFAHNDYAKETPFTAAYDKKVGFIEADIFLEDGQLLVAHTRSELNKNRTLETLYLGPLQKQIIRNNQRAYPKSDNSLTLMIDLKTDGEPALNAIVEKLKAYPELLFCKSFHVAVSGNMPDPALWKNYPTFIHFDGRPGINYTKDQLDRLVMISDSFRNYTTWSGEGELTATDREALEKVIRAAHTSGKKIRFWGAPDAPNAWTTLMKLNVDIINTDNVSAVAAFILTNGSNREQ